MHYGRQVLVKVKNEADKRLNHEWYRYWTNCLYQHEALPGSFLPESRETMV